MLLSIHSTNHLQHMELTVKNSTLSHRWEPAESMERMLNLTHTHFKSSTSSQHASHNCMETDKSLCQVLVLLVQIGKYL